MGTILNFPGKGNCNTVVESKNEQQILKVIFKTLFHFVRLPVFLVLYWLRLPVKFTFTAIGSFCMVAFMLAWIVHPEPKMLFGFGLLSFISFCVLFAYDLLLIALNPMDSVFIL